ncbi:putative dehydrogenase [Evansella vedderi]|uniref:Dehydrogenase n=2 Tax=Evansella vedderi TaxID=38282 RepID=A0ABT9ZVT2_9BACI|nr:putative dehydrogenase [Evansella vedderi]
MIELEEEIELVALCDINEEKINTFLKKIDLSRYTNLSTYTDARRFLQNDGIELVVIATSTDSHIPLIRQALQAKKHVLVEKPLALSIEEARSVVEEANRLGCVLAVSLQTRYLTQIQAIKKAMSDDRFGGLLYGVVTVRWNRTADYYKASPWRGTWEKDGGVLMNQCIHYIDLLQWVMGPVVSVYGKGGTFVHPIEAEDVGVAILHYANGSFGIVEGTTGIFNQNLQTSLSLFGEKGYVSLEGERLNNFKHWNFKAKRPEDKNVINQIAAISHTPLYEDIIHSIRHGTKPLVSADTTLGSLETVLAIYKSMLEKKSITLPLQQFSTKEMINYQLKKKRGKSNE